MRTLVAQLWPGPNQLPSAFSQRAFHHCPLPLCRLVYLLSVVCIVDYASAASRKTEVFPRLFLLSRITSLPRFQLLFKELEEASERSYG